MGFKLLLLNKAEYFIASYSTVSHLAPFVAIIFMSSRIELCMYFLEKVAKTLARNVKDRHLNGVVWKDLEQMEKISIINTVYLRPQRFKSLELVQE